jgi:hypothetical protein
MMRGASIGYIGFFIVLLLVTGGLILYFDKKGYANSGMKKEHKTAHFLGWFNIAAGIATFIGNWLLQKLL